MKASTHWVPTARNEGDGQTLQMITQNREGFDLDEKEDPNRFQSGIPKIKYTVGLMHSKNQMKTTTNTSRKHTLYNNMWKPNYN